MKADAYIHAPRSTTDARRSPCFTPANEHTMIASPTSTLFEIPAGAWENPRTKGEITIHAPRRTHIQPAALMEFRSLAVVFMPFSMEARGDDVNNWKMGWSVVRPCGVNAALLRENLRLRI